MGQNFFDNWSQTWLGVMVVCLSTLIQKSSEIVVSHFHRNLVITGKPVRWTNGRDMPKKYVELLEHLNKQRGNFAMNFETWSAYSSRDMWLCTDGVYRAVIIDVCSQKVKINIKKICSMIDRVALWS